MTNTDRIEIANLIDGAKKMKEQYLRENEKYIDEKIVNYATAARMDYIANKEYIKNVVSENLGIFFNLGDFEVSNCGSSNHALSAMGGMQFPLSFSNGLTFVLRFVDCACTKNNGYTMHFDVKDMRIENIRWYTSNTKDSRYGDCSSDNLVDRDMHLLNINAPRTSAEWNRIYVMALRTRAVNEIMVAEFKNLLKKRLYVYKELADTTERNKKANGTVLAYEKVSV